MIFKFVNKFEYGLKFLNILYSLLKQIILFVIEASMLQNI